MAMQDHEWLRQARMDVARTLLADKDCIAALKAGQI